MLTINNLEFNLLEKNNLNKEEFSEKAVELPLADYFLRKFSDKQIIEIGDITKNYFNTSHKTISEESLHFDNRDGNFQKKIFSKINVISISNIQNIGRDSSSSFHDFYPFSIITKIVNEADNYLITIPFGINSTLDNLIKLSGLKHFLLERINIQNDWRINSNKDINYKYNFPYENANAIFVITNLSFNNKYISEKLNLGCGNNYRDGWINVDIGQCKKDIEHDLEDLPFPFEDNSFGYILLQHVLEHIDRKIFPEFLRELHRISKPGCTIHIEVPYYNSKNAWTDFTHKNFLTDESFGYFEEGHHLRHLGVIYGIDFTFKKTNLNFIGPADNLSMIMDLIVEKL